MYQIISEGQVIDTCEEPRYIKYKPASGCYVQTTADKAQGVAVHSLPYNLPGHTEITRDVYNEVMGISKTVIAPVAEVVKL
jgi:hypothetical protein